MVRSLKRKGVHESVSRWIETLLMSRRVSAEQSGCSVTRTVTRGCPQGGVLSPLLWCLVVDELLVTLNRIKIANLHVQFYADDGTIMIVGPNLARLSRGMQTVLTKMEAWLRKSLLSVNPLKTEMVIFTNKRNTDGLVAPILFGEQLRLQPVVKYLGVFLDSKLSWRVHLDEKSRQMSNSLFQLKRAIGPKWGLSPKVMSLVVVCEP